MPVLGSSRSQPALVERVRGSRAGIGSRGGLPCRQLHGFALGSPKFFEVDQKFDRAETQFPLFCAAGAFSVVEQAFSSSECALCRAVLDLRARSLATRKSQRDA